MLASFPGGTLVGLSASREPGPGRTSREAAEGQEWPRLLTSERVVVPAGLAVPDKVALHSLQRREKGSQRRPC